MVIATLLEPNIAQDEASGLHGATALLAVLPKRGDSPKAPHRTSAGWGRGGAPVNIHLATINHDAASKMR